MTALELECRLNALSNDGVLKLLERRANPSACGEQLKSLSMCFGIVQQCSIIQKIRSFLLAGVKINLSYQRPRVVGNTSAWEGASQAIQSNTKPTSQQRSQANTMMSLNSSRTLTPFSSMGAI